MSQVLHLPHAIRLKVAQHLANIEQSVDLHALELAQERAQGFVEGIEAAGALTAATIEALSTALDNHATECRQELTA
uniref:Uncharacterized protein n=1 Tax=Pseudomonas fluorescens (strain SBW25) TaxID=216595 RepID=A0A0G4E5R2_PSEFS|nr:hypothetical protein [Pseudomonas fluorescens]CEK42545.1 hypothetical protein PQBR55_0166 [Pseudomonas fluorescens SBW25]